MSEHITVCQITKKRCSYNNKEGECYDCLSDNPVLFTRICRRLAPRKYGEFVLKKRPRDGVAMIQGPDGHVEGVMCRGSIEPRPPILSQR